MDLDTGAEVDLVSRQLIEEAKLRPAQYTAPLLEAVGKLAIPTYGVFEVPLTLTDTRGVSQSFMRPCVSVDRNSSADSSPVLLSMTSLSDKDIYLASKAQHWWLNSQPNRFELCSKKQFYQTAKNHAFSYSITQVDPADGLLPDDEEPERSTAGRPHSN